MKKKLVASLAAAMVLGVAGTSFAASNPFVDVPAKHWSYDAVTKLSQAGIVDGYGDGKFQGDKIISRYEMAQIIAKAMGHSDKATAAQKATIDKLAAEFASELEGLNVRVNKVEKRLSVLDKVEVGGAARIRYDHEKTAGVLCENINMDINYSYKVNEDWAIKGESEFNRNLRSTQGDSSNDNQFEQLYVTGPIAGTTVKVGKLSYMPAYGVVFDDKIRGAQVSFGKVVKTTLNVGKTDAGSTGIDSQYQAIDFAYAYSKDTNIKANFQKETSVAGAAVNYYEAGFDTKLSRDLTFQAAYAKSNANTYNKAFFAQVQYKAADTNVVGSNDIYVAYRKFDVNATIAATGDYTGNFKGVRIGYDYVPMKNAKFATWYMSGKTSDAPATDKKIFRAQVELFF